jgi:hypothetical protein
MDFKNNKYGILLNGDIKLQRHYFKEMCKLIGINVIYRAPKPGKSYTTYAEIKSNYEEPILMGCIFDEHPTQQTLKKMGWVSELQEGSSIIHIPYDTPNIQQGSLFTLPSGLDDGKGRLFRAVTISNIMVYPTSIACEIVPEYENTYQESQNDFKNSSFNLLREEDYRL